MGRHGGIQLIDYVCEGVRGMKCDVPRAGAIARTRGSGGNLCQFSAGWVECEGEHLVDALVGHQEEALGAVVHDLVRLGKWLLHPVRADTASELGFIRKT